MRLSDKFASLALKLLDRFGSDGELLATGPALGEFDQLTGDYSIGSPHAARPTRAAVAQIEVLSADGRKTYKAVATTLAEPQSGDTLTLDGKSYTVSGLVTALSVQGVPVCYQAEVS